MPTAVLGPPELGRGAVIRPDQTPPPSLEGVPIVNIDDAVIASPQRAADTLHQHWANRTPVVVRLCVDAAHLKALARETERRDPWQLGPAFLFHGQRLHFLVWNNNVDFRADEPIWWWSRKAMALGAQPSDEADVQLPDGRHAFCDGGPLEPAALPLIPYAAIEHGRLTVLQTRETAATLAPDQLAAVTHHRGPARIVAPAGSGKTRVLTERLRHVLSDWGTEPGAVCAVAYNTRAAAELTERTQGLPAHIRTLNSLALAIVSGTGPFRSPAIESSRRSMLDERDVRRILQQLVELPRRSNNDALAAWIDALSMVRLGLQSPDAVEASSGDLTGFADVFERYRAHLAAAAALDFDEQIYRAIEVLLQDPEARAVAQRRCRMLLVDEFQDLTPAHVLLLRLLALPAFDVFGVGDDDQVIYGYSGADPDYLVRFDHWFPGASAHALEVNYRCPPSVVTAASNLLTRNAVRVDKTIRPEPDRAAESGELTVEHVAASRLGERCLERVAKWIADGCAPTDIAVLTRVNVTLLPVQVLLGERGIPHTAPVNASLLDRTGIRTALAYLRIGLDPDTIDRNDLQDTIRRPSRKIARNIVDLVTKRPFTSTRELRRIASGLTGNDGPRLAKYVEDLERVHDSARHRDTAAALDVIRERIGLGDVMDVLDSSRREADRSTHADDLAAIAAVAHLHPDVATFEPWLRDLLSRRQQDGGVELSTVHRVKGREWANVIVYDASAGLLPHRLAGDKAEERRVFHVALTRCRSQVTVLADEAAPSPFLAELAAPGEPEKLPTRTARSDAKAPVESPSMPAAIGLTVSVPGGSEGTIVETQDESVVLSAGRARMHVRYGTSVRVHGKLVTLGPPLDPTTERILTGLKEWRRTTATALKVPAYTVFHDAHLTTIAGAAPASLAELARCKGVGEAKLERWGDEVLAAIDACR